MPKIRYKNMISEQLPIENSLRRLINESMCVAENVSVIVDDLLDAMWKVISNEPRERLKDIKNVYYNQFQFTFDLLENVTLPVVCRFLYFNSKQESQEYLMQHKISKPKYFFDKKLVYLNVVVVKNWFDGRKIGGSLQHEIVHAYNDLSSNSANKQSNLTFRQQKGREKYVDRSDRLYKIALKNLNNIDIGIKTAATAIYLLHGEITALTNGLYKRLYPVFMKKLISSYDEVLYNDVMYQKYLILKFFCKRIDDGNYSLGNATKLFQISEKRIITMCRTALQKTERGIAYAVQKAKLDFENEIFRSPNN